MAGIISDTNRLGGVPQSASRYVAMSTCFDVFLNGNIHVGFISQLSVGHTRTVTQIRHLNSADAGIAVDTVVTPDTPTLNFQGFYVYSSSTATAVPGAVSTSGLVTVTTGTATKDGEMAVGPTIGRVAGIQLLMTLDQQNVPFDIVVRHSFPDTNTNGMRRVTDPSKGSIVGVYNNCTISGMTIPIVVGTAAVSDSGVISVGYVSSGY